MTADTAALRRAFEEQFGRSPDLIAEAPGRVNLIGEHTDYNGGFVLPVAIDRTVAVALAPRDDGLIRAYSLDYDQSDEFPAERVRRFMGTKGGWRDYMRGVVWALLDEQLPVGGADIAITGDVPQGAGLSSSAALEVAVAGALTASTAEVRQPGLRGPESNVAASSPPSVAETFQSRRADLQPHREPRDLALLCQKAENLFVGVQSGIMDQFSSALGVAGHALFIDCRSLDVTPVPLPKGVVIAVIDSKVPRKLGDTLYNKRRKECEKAARALGLESLRDAAEPLLFRFDEEEDEEPGEKDTLRRRARHVITENKRVLAAVDALKGEDFVLLGRLMRDSHVSLRDDFGVSTPQLDLLTDLALTVKGVIGARLTGAGFGGCTVTLVRENAVDRLRETVLPKYRASTGLVAEMHVCRAVDGLRVTHV
jgi:galactokinase